MNPKKDLLIIFYRNPELGKVKTRLAATIGNEEALRIYIQLAHHTLAITQHLAADKVVYYSHFVDDNDIWSTHYAKKVQEGETLGDRMLAAFKWGFAAGYQNVCIIGTDCLELTSEIIQKAFVEMDTARAVLGPAKDGGYYLLGMNQLFNEVFKEKEWSTSTVAHDTIKDFLRLKVEYRLLPLLSDVDVEEDLKGKLL
jgi:hypothetical protein